MSLDHAICYKIIEAKDARFDGLFYTAVKTTGIYCRPTCKVPAPKSMNCTFYKTSAEAETNGYRPCLRCRPELAPGYGDFEQESHLISELIKFFDQKDYVPGLIGESAAELGISTRHVTRLFKSSLGVSPQAYMMTMRLLKAKMLLTDTTLSIAEISATVGFGSLSRFNDAFLKHYHMAPSRFRKKTLRLQDEDALKLKLYYRPPYDWTMMMRFFRMRVIPGVEWVTDDLRYRRTIIIQENDRIYEGWIEVKPLENSHSIELSVSHSLEKVLLTVVKKVKVAFDLDASPHLLPEPLPKGIRLPGCFDTFEMSARAILGQQITVKAALTLTKRMVHLLGRKIETPWLELTHHFPLVEDINKIDDPLETLLGPLGVIKNRSRSIEALAHAMGSGQLVLGNKINPATIKENLLRIKGIGPWTAEYLTMRGSSWPDAFPLSDVGIQHALSPLLYQENGERLMSNKESLSKYQLNRQYERAALKYAEDFRPWRSYLTIALWHSLSKES